MMKKLLTCAAILAAGLSSWGIAQASSGDNPTNAAKASPLTVAATVQGMPTTAEVNYAVVDSTGTEVAAQSYPHGSTYKAIHLGTGSYEVDFGNHNLTGCAFFATIGLPGSAGTSAPGFVTVVGRSGNLSGVFVDTYNAAGALADLGFHLQTAC